MCLDGQNRLPRKKLESDQPHFSPCTINFQKAGNSIHVILRGRSWGVKNSTSGWGRLAKWVKGVGDTDF